MALALRYTTHSVTIVCCKSVPSRGVRRCRPHYMSATHDFTHFSLIPGLSSYVHHFRVVHLTSGHQLSGTAEAGTRDERLNTVPHSIYCHRQKTILSQPAYTVRIIRPSRHSAHCQHDPRRYYAISAVSPGQTGTLPLQVLFEKAH